MPFGCGNQGALKRGQATVNAVKRVSGPELEISDNLIVATSRRVELSTDVPKPLDQPTLDVHVDIFSR
jgi:hypothetical protein